MNPIQVAKINNRILLIISDIEKDNPKFLRKDFAT